MHEVDDTNLDFIHYNRLLNFIYSVMTHRHSHIIQYFLPSELHELFMIAAYFSLFGKVFLYRVELIKNLSIFDLLTAPGNALVYYFLAAAMYELQLTERKISLNLLSSQEFF